MGGGRGWRGRKEEKEERRLEGGRDRERDRKKKREILSDVMICPLI